MYKLGQYFRERYYDLLGGKYSPGKVHVWSADADRSLMSAELVLAGKTINFLWSNFISLEIIILFRFISSNK